MLWPSDATDACHFTLRDRPRKHVNPINPRTKVEKTGFLVKTCKPSTTRPPKIAQSPASTMGGAFLSRAFSLLRAIRPALLPGQTSLRSRLPSLPQVLCCSLLFLHFTLVLCSTTRCHHYAPFLRISCALFHLLAGSSNPSSGCVLCAFVPWQGKSLVLLYAFLHIPCICSLPRHTS